MARNLRPTRPSRSGPRGAKKKTCRRGRRGRSRQSTTDDRRPARAYTRRALYVQGRTYTCILLASSLVLTIETCITSKRRNAAAGRSAINKNGERRYNLKTRAETSPEVVAPLRDHGAEGPVRNESQLSSSVFFRTAWNRAANNVRKAA